MAAAFDVGGWCLLCVCCGVLLFAVCYYRYLCGLLCMCVVCCSLLLLVMLVCCCSSLLCDVVDWCWSLFCYCCLLMCAVAVTVYRCYLLLVVIGCWRC